MPVDDVDLLDLLTLETIDVDLYRATAVFHEEYALYGGQVAAQALRAAGTTVGDDRVPHSLHGYFLRPGDPSRPTLFRVSRDRDGRSFSARRVVAVQNGEVIFNMVSSFHVAEDGPREQSETMPDVAAAEQLPVFDIPRLHSFESRAPEQPWEGRAIWPTRFWARATVGLGDDPLVHACALTYLSDISTGVLPSLDGSAVPSSSLDHALWFHDRADLNEWVLSEYAPRHAGHGRGLYTGTLFASDGTSLATVAQEQLYRAPRPR